MIIPPVLMAPSGRIFLRHPSHMGSVMIFNDRGIWRRVLVLDAKYRTKEVFGLFEIKIPEFQDFQLEEVNASRIDHTRCTAEILDSWISENIAWDPLTSRERCDVWMKYKNTMDVSHLRITGCPAVQYCRNIQVNGIPCDLPNIQTLARIYVDRETIDQMDPTVEEYYKLKDRTIMDYAWSSTNLDLMICVSLGQVINNFIIDYGFYKWQKFLVVPILEL